MHPQPFARAHGSESDALFIGGEPSVTEEEVLYQQVRLHRPRSQKEPGPRAHDRQAPLILPSVATVIRAARGRTLHVRARAVPAPAIDIAAVGMICAPCRALGRFRDAFNLQVFRTE